jgi:AraC-like DNA-binding protein
VTPDDNAPIISGVIGEYCELRPRADLEPHFQCLWYNELRADGGSRLAVAISALAPGSMVVGARFRPGAAHTWLGVPMSGIVGSRVALEEFWGSRVHAIAQRIGDAASAAERVEEMGAALSRFAPDFEPASPESGFVFTALRTESAGRGMKVVLDRLDVSPRTLRRRCQEAFGYGPKTLDRILRFQRFLRLARQAEEPRLAGLAFEAGYADQAHLTREVRRLSGFSPATILSQVSDRFT